MTDTSLALDARLDAARIATRTRLPAQPTRFLGREREVVEVCDLLGRDTVRLLTLTGPGGIGKTRLALEAARAGAARYEDGVAFAALAAIRDAAFLASAIADVLGLADQPGLDPVDTVVAHLAAREMLLVLDNLEQIPDSAAFIALLLAQCPALTVLAVSREPLRVSAENEYPVAPLDAADAVALFVERARAVRPGFAANGAIADICERVDRLPLAIELTAVRVRSMAAGEILRRLDKRLAMLTGGPRDVPERQRTLRAAIDWSHDLATPEEQKLFARLGVFVGGFTLEAAEEIADGGWETLQALVDRSLVVFTGERYALLETIGEYARERLEAVGETDLAADRHARWFLALAERAAPELHRAGTDRIWLDALEAERDNLRVALRRYIAGGRGDEAQRLAAALCAFWHDRGPAGEACDWVAQVLELPAAPHVRARALTRGSVLALWSAANDIAASWAQEGLAPARASADHVGVVAALTTLGVLAAGRHEYDEASRLLDEALDAARAAADEWAIGATLVTILSTDVRLDSERAVQLADEAADLRQVSASMRAMIEMCRGWVADQRREDEAAISLYRDSIALSREIGFDRACAPLTNLGFLHLRRGELAEARDLLYEAVERAAATGVRGHLAGALAYTAVLAAVEGDPLRAATLRGAVEAHRETYGEVPLTEFTEGTFDADFLADARAAAGEAAWRRAFEKGRAMSHDEAAALVVGVRRRFDPLAGADGAALTIMFTDIEGSTAMTERLGDRRWVEVLRTHDAIVCREVEFYRGGVVKSRGDGFMLAFPRADDAVTCAVAIQRAFADHNTIRADAPIRVRIGLHTGTAIAHDSDYYGRDVNLAARIADRAAGGEILVSDAVRDAVADASPYPLAPRPPAELKGLSGRHAMHAVLWDVAVPGPAAGARR